MNDGRVARRLRISYPWEIPSRVQEAHLAHIDKSAALATGKDS